MKSTMRKATLSVFDTNLCFKPTNCVRKAYRATQIAVCVKTSAEKQDFKDMIKAGMTIAVFDGKEGKSSLVTVEKQLKDLREALEEYNADRATELKTKLAQIKDGSTSQDVDCCDANVATAINLKSIYMETVKFSEDVTFEKGAEVKISNLKGAADSSTVASTKGGIFVDYEKIAELAEKTLIYINSYTTLRVMKMSDANSIMARVDTPGLKIETGAVCEVNISGVNTGNDGAIEDIQSVATFCRKNKISTIIVPVENAKSMKSIKCVINPEGDDAIDNIKVIAKVESMDAAQNIDTIVDQASGVMIGRKRLGRNVCEEQVPTYQKLIIAKCLQKGIPSIIANHVMKAVETEGKSGTRAEIADVFNAVLDGVDCVCLGSKAASSDAITSLKYAIFEAEDTINYRRLNRDLVTRLEVPCMPIHCNYHSDALALAATTCAMVNGASCIIVLSDSGRTAKYVAKYRPQAPIIVVAKDKFIAERCLLHCGIMAIVPPKPKEPKDPKEAKAATVTVSYSDDVENRIKTAIQFARCCSIINKLPALVVAVYASEKNKGKADTLRTVFVQKETADTPEDPCNIDVC